MLGGGLRLLLQARAQRLAALLRLDDQALGLRRLALPRVRIAAAGPRGSGRALRGQALLAQVRRLPEDRQAEGADLPGLAEDVAARGGGMHSEVRRLKAEPAADRVARELELAEGEPVIVLQLLRFVDWRPWAFVTTWILLALAEGLLDEDFTRSAVRAVGGQYGLLIAHGWRTVEAVAADAEVTAALGLEVGDPHSAAA
jgi:GntR family transcriptional regulator